jgi:pimeloyl-ACP methyl ester carboxylesterase
MARRVDIETHEDVAFANGDVRLAGTLISPKSRGRHPAIILVHGSGAENREFMLPYARFLIRRGIAVLGYDKRGVGASTGDWTTASFDDLAGDVIAAFEYLRSRRDIDAGQIGLLGVSQAGWIMPIAAVRAPGIAFVVSVSGGGVPADETAFDHARNEMTASGLRPEVIDQILEVMRQQYRFARTGEGWDDYLAARIRLAARLGAPPPSYPATRDDPLWRTMRAFYFYDPTPVLRRLRTPTLAIFGELDDNILAAKNKAAWDAALRMAGNPDYTLTITAKANHGQWGAKIGNDAEEATLQGFAPAYFATVEDWLSKRIRGFVKSR